MSWNDLRTVLVGGLLFGAGHAACSGYSLVQGLLDTLSPVEQGNSLLRGLLGL